MSFASMMRRHGKISMAAVQGTKTSIRIQLQVIDWNGQMNNSTNCGQHVGSIASLPGVTTITVSCDYSSGCSQGIYTDVVQMADDADHARQRRALSHAFSTKALLEQEYIVKGYIDVFSDKMKEFAKKGELVNVTDWFAYTTFDIIGDMALGEPFGCLTNGEYSVRISPFEETLTCAS
jgi:hypothetical protein